MTIDDFEWLEKVFEGTRYPKLAEHIDDLEAAKVIAVIHVNQHMEGYPNANRYRTRAVLAGPKKIPVGVFKVD